MTNKLVVIINSLKVPKIKKILLYEMKFLVPNYSCLKNPWRGFYRPQITVLSVLCSQLNLLNPPEQNFWVRHCLWVRIPHEAWMCECCVLSNKGLCVGLITRPEKFYRVWRVQWVWSRSSVRQGHDLELDRSATGGKKVWLMIAPDY